VNRSAFEVAEMMSSGGGAGSKLTLSVSRGEAGGERGVFDVELVRGYGAGEGKRVGYSIVEAEGGGAKVGYIRVSEFTSDSAKQLREAAARMTGRNGDKGGEGKGVGVGRIVIDVRGNRGGLLESALEISSLFIQPERGDDGEGAVLLWVVEREGGEDAVRRPPKGGALTVPLTVLVDRNSASASEVLASSLKDNCRAAVVGPSRTFGKGLVQGAFPLGDGSAAVLTVAEYLTPKHTRIQVRDMPCLPRSDE
jgi:carboxyl-terminal processing protease